MIITSPAMQAWADQMSAGLRDYTERVTALGALLQTSGERFNRAYCAAIRSQLRSHDLQHGEAKHLRDLLRHAERAA